ncbi:MAG: hypothetical protein ABIB43_03895 [archaeon]
MEDYKLCLLAGGKGNRMASFTKHFNKAMIPLKAKPAISHIIEKNPRDIEIVIAIAYLGEGLREYIPTAHPDRTFSFVEVDKYVGYGTGPGYGLLKCKGHLQCPFVVASVDTIVLEDIPEPNENWFGVARVPNTERFCSAKVSGGKVIRIDDKVKTDNEFAFIGLAGIKDYEIFWNSLESNQKIIGGEIQISNGLTSLIEKDLYARNFTWFDVGTPDSYAHAVKNYPQGNPYRGE